MKKLSEQNRLHLAKKAAKGQNRWRAPRVLRKSQGKPNANSIRQG